MGLLYYIQDILSTYMYARISGAVSAYNPNEITLHDLADNSGIFLLQVGVTSNILWSKRFPSLAFANLQLYLLKIVKRSD